MTHTHFAFVQYVEAKAHARPSSPKRTDSSTTDFQVGDLDPARRKKLAPRCGAARNADCRSPVHQARRVGLIQRGSNDL